MRAPDQRRRAPSRCGPRPRRLAHGVSPTLLARWQRLAAAAAPDRADQAEIARLRVELRRVEQERDILKKVVTIFSQPPQS